jgi:hypothetical protein
MKRWINTWKHCKSYSDTITICHYCCDVGDIWNILTTVLKKKRLYLASTLIIVFQSTLRELWLTNKKKVHGGSDNTVKEAEYSWYSWIPRQKRNFLIQLNIRIVCTKRYSSASIESSQSHRPFRSKH